jgi:plastocyanin
MTNTTKGNSKKNLALVGVAAVAVGFLLAVAGTVSISSAQSQEQGGQEQQQTESEAQNGTMTVEAGGGDAVAPVTWFIPQNVTIRVGDTVIWTNPTPVPEPHTVSFIRQEGYFAALQSPYLIPNGTELSPANPNEQNTEPFIIPGQNDTTSNTIIVVNNRSASPVIVDAQNNAIYLPLNANYTMTGDELYVNSGWIWPEGQIPPGAPPITSFSVKFENAGTYDYLCLLHPWMTGRVVVQ